MAVQHGSAGLMALLSPSGLVGSVLGRVAADIVSSWFQSVVQVMTSLAQWLMVETWKILSATTEPVLSGPASNAFKREFLVMAIIGATATLPLLCVGIIQSIARQDVSSFLRSVLVRVPFALLFTGAAVELVSLCLAATDEASGAVLSAAGDPARRLFTGLAKAIVGTSVMGTGIGAAMLVAGTMAAVAFVLWVELVVRSAAVAAATLFLPLALAGLAWPATTHWARRLGETIAGLILMKLVIAGVLALAATAIGGREGISGVVEGVALLGLATFAPFTLLRLIPMIEAGAVAHLEAAHHRTTATVAGVGKQASGAWLGGVGALANSGNSRGSGNSQSSGQVAMRAPNLDGTGPGGSGGPGGGPGFSGGAKATAAEATERKYQGQIDAPKGARHGAA